jgi:hypothetical protein
MSILSNERDSIMKKVFIVIELPKNDVPNILDVFDTEKKANNAVRESKHWCQVVEKEVK